MKEIEIIEKRGYREKHFLQENGNIKARVYSSPIHYKKNGKYEDIDNTLTKKKDYYINQSNDYQVYFNEHSKDILMKIEKDNNYLEIKFKDCRDVKLTQEERKSKLIETVTYKDILEGIDFKYEVLPTKVKENIIINNSKNIQEKLIFIINTNLKLTLNEGVLSAKKEKEDIFLFEVPYMIDAKNNINNNISYNLNLVEKHYELELVLDSKWLSSKDTIYPVIIDPTIIITGPATVHNTFIYPGDTGINKTGLGYLIAGVQRINSNNRTNRALIKFDLPVLGTGSEVINATLIMESYQAASYPAADKLSEIHRVTENWNAANANWTTMNNKYDDRVEAIYYAHRFFPNAPLAPMIPGYITELVKKWYTGTPNYGIMLKVPDESVYVDDNYPMFYSSGNGVLLPQAPVLEIEYFNQNGLESYLNYQSQPFVIGTTHINSYNGNLTGIFDLGSTIGGKLPASVGLVYNTNDVVLNNTTVYGKGYKLTLDQTVKVWTVNNLYLEYLDEDGTLHYFFNNGNEYHDESGKNRIIIEENDKFIMKNPQGNEMIFIKKSGIGYLSEIKDVKSNVITITRDANNVITQITDANAAEINFDYGTANIIKIESPDRDTELSYLNGKIATIETIEGTTTITYDSNDLIKSVADVNGMKLDYTYYDNSPYKVKKITQYGLNDSLGDSFTLDYGFNTTAITDNTGKVKRIMFNSIGNAISTNSLASGEDINDAYSFVEGYDKEINKNKLLSDSIPVMYINNLLRNTSFEENTNFWSSSGGLTQSFSTDTSFSGNRSLKLVSTVTNQKTFYPIAAQKGKRYTFSGYFKNDQEIRLSLSYIDATSGHPIETIQVVKSSDEFTREDITIYYPDDAVGGLKITVYLDDIGTTYMDVTQLEEGEVANSYNMLENSDFRDGLLDWTLEVQDLDTGTFLPTSNVFEVINFNNNKNKALKVSMKSSNRSSFKKSFPIKGKAGDLYHISFWYKNEGIQAIDEAYSPIGNSVVMIFYPTDPNISGHTIPSPSFPPNENMWQYFSYKFTAENDYDSMLLWFSQGRMANNLYITNLSLYKGIDTSFYEYDLDGNLTRIKNQDMIKSILKYDKNNELINISKPEGINSKCEYDNIKTNLPLCMISSSGIANKIQYGSNDKPIVTRISKMFNEDITEGKYEIRSKGTNNYLKEQNKQIIIKSDSCSHSRWVLEKVNDDYKINCVLIPNYYITYSNNSIILSDGNINNLFTLEKNENGSYLIKVKNESKYLKINGTSIEATNLVINNPEFEFYFEIVGEKFLENTVTYNEDGRFATSITNNNLNKTLFETDSITGLRSSLTNAKGIITSYTYTNKEQLASITVGNRTVTYNYNNQSLLSEIAQGNKEYKLFYDDFLNLNRVTINDEVTLVDNAYEVNNGNLLSNTYGNNHTITFDYDDFNRIKTIHKMDNDYNYIFDSNSNIAKVVSNDSIAKFTYDTKKRLHEYRLNDNFKINYNYNATNNTVDVKYKLDNIVHSSEKIFNSNKYHIKTIFDNFDFDYQYDNLGRLINKSIDDSYNITKNYLSYGRRATDLIDSITNGNNKYNYKYDILSNITHIYYNDVLIKEYWYDDYNQLIEEKNYVLNEKIEYTYDEYGNILYKKKYDLDTETLISQDEYTYDNPDWEDQLTEYNNQEITYDEIGNPLSIGNDITMSWINGRQLSSYQNTTNNKSISYKYNDSGIRISKTINNIETKYYLEGSDIIYEQRGNDVLYYIYDLKRIVGMYYNGNDYYFIKNLHGDIIGILDSSYNQIVTYEYDSWGKVLSIVDTSGINLGEINPFRYRSYYYDTETNLYYLNSRYYSPEVGRFINADGIVSANPDIHAYNLYAYCSNNPISNYDPTGMSALSGMASGLSAAAKGVAQATKQAKATVATCPVKQPTIQTSPFTPPPPLKSPTPTTLKPNTSAFNPNDYFYKENASKNGIDMNVDPVFLSRTNCLIFAQHIIDKYENGELAYGMSKKRIAIEIYAHAVVYYATDAIDYFLLIDDIFDGTRKEANGDENYSYGLNVNNDEISTIEGFYNVIWAFGP